MKILWVEDFGGELEPLQNIIEVFSGLIPLDIDDLRREFDPDDEDSIGQLVNLIENHTPHELHVCNSYVEWKEVCERQAGDFDVVLVDIDLTSYPTPSDARPEGVGPKFDEKAGLYIYHQLIKRGVPDRNIALLTGERGMLADFLQHCDEIMLARPKNVFEKTPLQFKALNEWIVQKSRQETRPTQGKLLLVDDEEGILMDVASDLRDHGYEVITAEDGRQALLLTNEYEFDVVITDVMMPYVSGLQFLEDLHARKPTIPVILFTGFADNKVLRQALRFRAFDVINKPDPESLSLLLESVRRATWEKTVAVKHRKLRVFLCHSSEDKKVVRELYRRLCSAGFDPWFDEEKLIPGQDWQEEILKAVRSTDVAIACLSRSSIKKQGFIQKEIKYLLDFADEQPEGTLSLIPLRLEPCDIPERLRRWHWADLFEEKGHDRLVSALRLRASGLGLVNS